MEKTNEQLDEIRRATADAMALLWTWRPRTSLYQLLQYLDLRVKQRRLTQEDVKLALDRLIQNGQCMEHKARPGFFSLTEPFRTRTYVELLERFPEGQLREALYRIGNFNPTQVGYFWPADDFASTVAIFRFALFTGANPTELYKWRQAIERRFEWSAVFREAVLTGAFEPALFARITPLWRWDTLYLVTEVLVQNWDGRFLPMTRWALETALAHPEETPEHLRMQLAEWCLLSKQYEALEAILAREQSGGADALRAARLIQRGEWAEGQAAFEAAFKKRQAEMNVRKRLLPTSLAWFYPLALLAQGEPKHVELARKFCLGEAGTRNPPPEHGWGLWVHACAMRLGERPLDPKAFDLAAQFMRPTLDTLWTLLMRAWLATELPLPGSGEARSRHEERVAQLIAQLNGAGLSWLEEQARSADRILRGEPVEGVFFVKGQQEAWRNVLATLRALAGESPVPADRGGEVGETRLIWNIVPGKAGRLEDIVPYEQKRGARGWSKPRPASLSKLASNTSLPPHDAKVARTIRASRYHAKSYYLELSAAIMALVGHPHVVLAGAFDYFVDVVEGMPQLETVRETDKEGEHYVLRIRPEPHDEPQMSDGWQYYLDEAQKRDAEALRYIHLEQESPQRLKVIRLTPAQRRAAQLVAGRCRVPVSAQNELQEALRALAGHFDVHSDEAAAAREVAAISTLRAELSPIGAGLLLRLVVAPLGPLGPRLMPGRGRRRVMAAVGGQSIGTERDLAAEAAHLDAVLERLDFLPPPAAADTVCEWQIDDPELALALVETLPQLPAIEAVDWPRGKPLRVTSVDLKQLQITVKSERDWLRVSGQVALDEGRVFALQELLAAAQQKSRFIALGEGEYLALSKALRERLQALAAVAEEEKGGVKAPTLAAPWLEETLGEMAVEFDREVVARIERLRKAQEGRPALPATLQAQLRPYQEDGFVWAMRLAEAGFGACLADDMGLGKTLQALAVLLARAAGGAALVVAPTSVCGNWLAEARRFAPTLNARIYGEGERKRLIEEAGPGDLLIVSYTLMQQAGEDFAARRWHTLVADEAQAVKNAAAKRSQALFEIPADFRLALSGTPVENRLAELWSIMHFCNPGLLGTPSRFTERFANPIERSRDREAQRLLRRLVAPFVLRRSKAQVLDDLPPRTELVLSVVPEPDEAAHYEALRRTLVSEAERLDPNAGQTRLHILAQLTKLRRAACDPRLVTPELGYVGAKVRAFAELAQELSANGHKALVFSQFVDFLALLRAPLEEAGIPYQYLDGATPPEERTRRVAAFQAGEGDLFLISLKAGGFGLNLTAADYVVITDPWWNPAAEDQAMGRAHRIGQQRPVTVYRLVSQGTLEERIIELHHEKRALAEGVLAEGGEAATLPSTEELIALLRA
ncbi:MAG: SNF2 family helicase [Rhodocyclaceae bacterium]|nr:SNF2 family helicase [Rhodocyclaceae bacterium]